MRGLFLGLWALVFSALLAGAASGHGGGLDGYGGHHNRKQGTYHFHHGPLAGIVFPGKAEALDALKRYMEEADLARRQGRSQEPPQARQAENAKTAGGAEQGLVQPRDGHQ